MEQAPGTRRIGVRLGGLTIMGPWAIVILAAVQVLIVILVVRSRPSLRMLLSAAIWIAFLLYWNAAARRVAPVTSSESPRSRALHQYLMNGALLLLFLPVPGLVSRFLPASPLLAPLGLSVQGAFFILAGWARHHLGRNWTGAITVVQNHQLVQSGPYRWVRHPIYTAMLGMCAGTALVSGEWHALVGWVVMALAYARKIRMEERSLRGAFGDSYDQYARQSWALVPGVF